MLFFKHMLNDVHFLNTKCCGTQGSILRTNLYPPSLDDRLHVYPFSSNLFTTRNNSIITLLFFLLLVVQRNSFLLYAFILTRTCSKLVARIRRDVIHNNSTYDVLFSFLVSQHRTIIGCSVFLCCVL